ncbi:DMT family transporter [Desulfogranum japonicum]|uniref:DMT family transporter n=1 Tax=Desulfogranum japonicum TaxID=231447 RepID=UPI00041985C3|nr:DMT family transporter [Desulfogranum japonicum]
MHISFSRGDWRPSQRFVPTMAMLLAVTLWGSSFVAMKIAFTELDPFFVVFGRLTIASLCFLPFVRRYGGAALQRRHILPLVWMALCEPCFYFLFETFALQYTSASQASMITTMLPLMVVLTAALVLKEKLSRKTVAGFLVAAAGALWLTLAGDSTEQAPKPVLGNFLELIAMACATGYIILAKVLTRELSPVIVTAVQSIIGALFFFPFLFLPQVALPFGAPASAFAIVLYLGLFVSVGAYGLYNYGVSRLPASQASAFINLIPVFSIALGFLLLGERLNCWQVIACILVFSGVIISQDRKSCHLDSEVKNE